MADSPPHTNPFGASAHASKNAASQCGTPRHPTDAARHQTREHPPPPSLPATARHTLSPLAQKHRLHRHKPTAAPQRAPPARSAQRLSSPPAYSHRLRPATTSSKQRLVSPPPQLGAEPSLPPGSPRTRRHLRMHDTPQRSPLPFETLRQRAPRTARRPTPRPPPPTTLSATASSPQSPQLALALASDSLPEDANPHRLAQLAAPLRSATRAGPPSSTSHRQEYRQFLRDRLPPPRQGVPSPSSSCDASGSPSRPRHPRPHRPTSTPSAYAAPSAGRPLT